MKTKTCKACGGSGQVPADRRQFAKSLRKLREGSGISQAAMARKLGVSAPFLSDLERGARNWPSKHERRYRAIVEAAS